jgi:hypothetical protein
MNEELINKKRAQELAKKWACVLEAPPRDLAKVILIEGQEQWIAKKDLNTPETTVDG